MSGRVLYEGYLLTKDLDGMVAKIPGYFLMAGDLLVKDNDFYTKIAPGLCITNIAFTDDQKQYLEPVSYGSDGLNFWLSPSGEALRKQVRAEADEEEPEAVERERDAPSYHDNTEPIVYKLDEYLDPPKLIHLGHEDIFVTEGGTRDFDNEIYTLINLSVSMAVV